MKKSMWIASACLVTTGLLSGCHAANRASRAEAARAQQQSRPLNVDVNVKRTEVTPPAGAAGSMRAREGTDVAGAMLRPEECPLVEGASVAIVDLGDGAALEFVTDDADDVQRVRDRVLNVAIKHQRAMQVRLNATEPHAGAAAEHGGEAVEEQAAMEAAIDPMPASHVAVVDVDRGARIIFVPVERRDLDALNQTLRQRASYMAEGSCPANLMSMRVPEPDAAG